MAMSIDHSSSNIDTPLYVNVDESFDPDTCVYQRQKH